MSILKLIRVGNIFFSQIFITVLNTVFSILLLRILPIDEFSTYILVTTYISILVTCSDMGISQSLVSIGAINKSNTSFQIFLSKLGCEIRNNLFQVFFILFLVFLFYSNYNKISNNSIILISLTVFLISYLQGIIQIKKSIFIINYNTKISFKIGLIESLIKLCFLPICFFFPTYHIVIIGLFISNLIPLFYINHITRNYKVQNYGQNFETEIYNFIKPLIPVVIFTVVQGNFGIIFLNHLNNKYAIAQFGALGRISMLFSTLLILNNYILQPYFANIKSLKLVKLQFLNFCIAFILFSILILLTIHYFSNLWLMILGSKYSNLHSELFLVASYSLINLFGASVYTILISRKYTKGQFYYILLGIIIQFMYYYFIKVSTLNDILYINIMMSMAYLLVQFYFLRKLYVNEL